MNSLLSKLQPYPFEKLAQLKAGIEPPAGKSSIMLSIGEPKHAAPQFVLDALCGSLKGFSSYPLTIGSEELRTAIAQWLVQRFSLPETSLHVDKHILPVNGTREALFAFAQAVLDPAEHGLVVMPNPFYQIYEGAALLAGAEPYFMPVTAETGFVPDFTTIKSDVWQKCKLLYVCSPGNPTGAVLSMETLKQLVGLAQEHDFVIASDECYSEIYFASGPPAGLLQAAEQAGVSDYRNCVVFHSLSKRSNLPGMRSGFVAGDASIMDKFRLYRTYHGCAMAPPVQAASTAAWRDEEHVEANRDFYQEKFDAVLQILQPVMNVTMPAGAFYLWPETPVDDVQFAAGLFETQNVTVLPGSYLSRTGAGGNPGERRVRIALVASIGECVKAAERIRDYVTSVSAVRSGYEQQSR